jgi:hypothetical protein
MRAPQNKSPPARAGGTAGRWAIPIPKTAGRSPPTRPIRVPQKTNPGTWKTRPEPRPENSLAAKPPRPPARRDLAPATRSRAPDADSFPGAAARSRCRFAPRTPRTPPMPIRFPTRLGRFLHPSPNGMANGTAGDPPSHRLAPGGFYARHVPARLRVARRGPSGHARPRVARAARTTPHDPAAFPLPSAAGARAA